jgi:hypothetical protein
VSLSSCDGQQRGGRTNLLFLFTESLEAELEGFRSFSGPHQLQQQQQGQQGAYGVVSPASSRSDLGPFSAGRHAFHPVEGLASAYGPHAGEHVSQSTLSETIRSVFIAGSGIGPPYGQGQQTVETFLRGVAMNEPEIYGVTSQALGGGGAGAVGGGLPGIGPSRGSSQLARKAMGHNLVIHLVQCAFSSFLL